MNTCAANENSLRRVNLATLQTRWFVTGTDDPWLGTNDQSVRGRLLRESKLTFNSAIDICRTSERTASQLKKLQGHGKTHSNQVQVNYAAKGGQKKHTKEVKHKQKKFPAQPSNIQRVKFQMQIQWFAKANMTIDVATRQDVICQLDSGSTCNIFGYLQYCILTRNGWPPLKRTAKDLRLYGGKSKLEPLGTTSPAQCKTLPNVWTFT